MDRRCLLNLLLVCGATLGLQGMARGQTAANESSLNVEEVVRLTRAGFSEEIIVTKIKKNAKAFDLSTDELLDLRKAGVSDNVIKYMLDPSQPYTPPVIAPSGSTSVTKPNSGKKYPEDSLASRVPADPGLYFFSGSPAASQIDLKFFLGTEEGKSLMKKGKAIAYLIGPAAKTRMKVPPVFYARLPEGKEIAELVLIGLTSKNGRRQLDVGPPGPKQQLNADDIRQFDSVEAGLRLFKITPPKLSAGEYTFFFIGSAEPPKGIYGKGYDFEIEGAPQAAPKHKKS